MKIYNYNKDTKEFTTSTNATANPLEDGKYLIPTNATTKEPIAPKGGFAVCFNEEKKEWEYQEDNRTKTAYDTATKQEIKISYLGALKDGFTFDKPKEFDKWNGTAWETDLKALKDKKLSDINNSCDKAIVSGFKSSALGEEHFYYSTLEEQSTLNLLINLGVDNQFKAQKITLVDGIETKEARKAYPHTIQQLRDVLADGFTHIATQVAKKDNLETQINNATTIEEVEAISWEV